MNTTKVIGIDLGTTYSCVAYYHDNKVEIIENKSTGLRTTPSIVTFTDYERVIGKPSRVSENTIYEIKRLIGRNFNDMHVTNDIKKWNFKVIDKNNRPKIKVDYKKDSYEFYPEQISAMILTKMKQIAELHLVQEVTDAVITVPAYFNDAQRQATKDAAQIAGLNVIKIINEPTAAAIAYGYDKKITTRKNLLVYDLGGGTFDVSIVKIENGSFTVIAIGGDTHLGGCDFDNNMVEHFIKYFKTKYGKDISTNKRALFKLRTQCELAKRALSEAVEALIEIDSFFEGEDFVEKISRALFERINDELFSKTITVLKETLDASGLKKQDIDDIVLVGGSIRIPKIQSLIKEFFDGKEPFQNINPDEAVAYGAALQAAILVDKTNSDFSGLQIVDVTPLSLGFEINVDEMSTLIPRNTQIPCARKKVYTTRYENQRSMAINIYEGERPIAKDNLLIEKFFIENIQLAPVGVPKVEITFSIDQNGILEVRAQDLVTLSKNSIKLENYSKKLEPTEINKMIELAKQFENEDKIKLERAQAKNNLEIFCNKRANSKLESTRNQIYSVLNWVENDTLTTDDILNKLKYLESLKI